MPVRVRSATRSMIFHPVMPRFLENYVVEDTACPETIRSFLRDGLITEVVREIKSGKEGTVYCCRAVPSTGYDLLAAKVYRPRHKRTFHNDAVYQEGRFSGKRRETLAVENRTRKGRVMQAAMWVNHEYEVLRVLAGAGADVPRALASTENSLLLEYFGDEEVAAPMLSHVTLPPNEVRVLLRRLTATIELLLRNDIIHGDLSPYNILYHRGRAVMIDFPQAVDARFNSNAFTLLLRDITNVCDYFADYGVKSDPTRMAEYLWKRYVRAEL